MKETNLSLAKKVVLKPIQTIAEKLGIDSSDLETYGKYKAKLPLSLINENKMSNGKLILVTAMTPTPQGEGKTTITVGLNEALNAIGKNAIAALREPSLGPVFGIKGGATGGGNAQVLPMEDINLHFTGDAAAVEKSNNLLSSLIDNFVQNSQYDHKLEIRINPATVVWKRVIDSNDRFLRSIVTGLGGKVGGVPTETGFNITAASEIMAILCLSKNLADLKKKIGGIYIGDTYNDEPVFVRDLGVEGAMTLLLKDAIKPNLVQTTEGNPALIHGGPFANIAQGTSSLIATKMGMTLCDYTVTEAGFAGDLGAEKFLNIKCGYGGIAPHVVVIVATLKALKHHGQMMGPSQGLEAVERGFVNLKQHIENVGGFGLPSVVAINKFADDNPEELARVQSLCAEIGTSAFVCDVWWQGSKGALELAAHVVKISNHNHKMMPTYEWAESIESKILAIAKKIYRAEGVRYTPEARKKLEKIQKIGLGHLPICMAKTPLSFSDDPKLIGAPRDFTITIRDFEISSGAGFVVPLAGTIMRMPGLPKEPAALKMDIDGDGNIVGLN